MTNIAEPTAEMIEAGVIAAGEFGLLLRTRTVVAIYTAMRSSAPQEPDDATCGDCGKPYSEHRRALAADVVWCPGDAIRTYVAQEPVADDDAIGIVRDVLYRRFPTEIDANLLREAAREIVDRLQGETP